MIPLKLHCSVTPGDMLEANAAGHNVVISIEDLTDPDGNECAVMLDTDKARELFNWLGVYLHTEAGE